MDPVQLAHTASNIFGWTAVSVGAVATVLELRGDERCQPLYEVVWGGAAVGCGLLALYRTWIEDYPNAIFQGLLMCYCIWRWRKRRGGRRRRWVERALGYVVNLGHRLDVRHAPAPAGNR